MKILVTGAAGYVGLHLVDRLLKSGYKVKAVDNFFKSIPNDLIGFVDHPNFEFMFGDLTSVKVCEKAVDGVDCIANLAGVVGQPLSDKHEKIAELVNVGIVENLTQVTNKLIIQASTGSVYGEIVGQKCTETIACNPLSWYGITKLRAEKALDNRKNAVSLRFATGCGLSPKLRNDLLVNSLVYHAVCNGIIAVYQADFMRTFISVKDMARAFHFFIDRFANDDKRITHEIYNVGDESLNISKRNLAEFIGQKTSCTVVYPDGGYKDPDLRNYEVSTEKINNVGFKTIYTLDNIVDELIKGFKILKH